MEKVKKEKNTEESKTDSKTNNKWKVAKKSKKQKAEEIVVRKISKVLAIAALTAMAAKVGYYYGYNSDFAKHFWDNTKMRMEEQRKEREALKPKMQNGISIQYNGEIEIGE